MSENNEAAQLDLSGRKKLYLDELLNSIVPFWTERAVDWEHGGILTCISDDGRILSTDKYIWSQLRAIWTFSALYNYVEPRKEWLYIARHIYQFIKNHGRDEAGRWRFCVDRRGAPLQGAVSIYSDGFAIYALTELARAAGDEEMVRIARQTYENVSGRIAAGGYQTMPYPLPAGMKTHGVSMLFSLAFFELGQYLNSREITGSAMHHAHEVMQVFLRPERRLLFEYVDLDNRLIDSPQGRAVVPGHAIESMWFMIRIFQDRGDSEKIDRAIEAIRWHIEFGWDPEYGGIVLSRDADGGKPWWRFADAKLWWPHTEALYALLLAHAISGQQWALQWYERVHQYAFAHFPVPGHGEWTQKLDRKGDKITETVALPVKDPFHLPRALIYSIELLENLEQIG